MPNVIRKILSWGALQDSNKVSQFIHSEMAAFFFKCSPKFYLTLEILKGNINRERKGFH